MRFEVIHTTYVVVDTQFIPITQLTNIPILVN